MQSLGVFYYEVCPVLVRHGPSESGFYLPGDVEVVEYGQLALVEFDNADPVRSYERHVLENFIVYATAIDVDVLVAWVEEVSQHSHGPARFLEDEGG